MIGSPSLRAICVSLCSVVLLSLVFTPLAAGADVLDYDPYSDDWTGLSRLVDAANVTGILVQPADEINFTELEPDQPLIIIYPKQALDVPSLTRFVVDGGRVLIADDFGNSEDFLERLEIQRILPGPRNLPHGTFANDNPALPIVQAIGRHALLDGVDHVVANHPAVLSNVGGPVLSYEEGGGLAYDMNLGEGKVVVIADASLFINRMLDHADNEVFLANALRYICRDELDCRPILVTKSFEQVGTYSDSPFDFDVTSLDAINDAIQDVLRRMPGGEFLYWITLLLGFGLAVYVGTVFPIRRTRPYSAYVSDFLREIPAPQSEFDWNVSRFGQGSRTMNYALPLAILKEIFEELFLDELGRWPPQTSERPDVKKLGDEFAVEFLSDRTPDERAEIRAEVVELLATFAQIPPRSRVFLDNDAHFGEGDLLRYHARVMHVLEIMGLEDEYQRRTRGIV